MNYSSFYEMYYGHLLRMHFNYNSCTMKCSMAIVRTSNLIVVHTKLRITTKNANAYYSHDVLRANARLSQLQL